VRAKGTVRPSERPIMASETIRGSTFKRGRRLCWDSRSRLFSVILRDRESRDEEEDGEAGQVSSSPSGFLMLSTAFY